MVLSKKTLISSIAAILVCLSLAAPSFANTSSKPVTGYGTLTGTLSGSNYITKVTQNPDSAQLSIKGIYAG
ncbi:hypothetical protein [Siminovitchia sp. FSL W7-1587]|uniref:hypothetical protein n=1 Tax=Siminovitchia sp. FSL W7-1587 TaxID=2954699 RepID=UPI0030D007B0